MKKRYKIGSRKQTPTANIKDQAQIGEVATLMFVFRTLCPEMFRHDDISEKGEK